MTMTNYVWDPLNDSYLMETDGVGAATAVYTQEPSLYGGVISQRGNNDTSYYHTDRLGSTMSLTNLATAVVATYTFDAWGNEVFTTGIIDNAFRWAGAKGYYFDAAFGEYNLRRRRYSPHLIRLLTIDPLESNDGRSRYAAFLNKPTVYDDPSGEVARKCCGGTLTLNMGIVKELIKGMWRMALPYEA